MKKNLFYLFKVVLLSILILRLLFEINHIVTPKYAYEDTWPTSITYIGFYQIPKNSVDVLFLGSSHAAAGFVPQELYNNYGITSYNLGCEQQNLLVSYYWLKEALHSQSPKVVVLDTYMLHTYNSNEPLNTAESCTRKAIDYMHWGRTKMETIHAITKKDSSQSTWSYYFTNIRFHTRWTELNAKDFSLSDLSQHCELKGYAPLLSEWHTSYDFSPFKIDCTVEPEPMVPLMQEYLEKITQLCSDNGIQLILVKTLTDEENQARYNKISSYAQACDIKFIDFNERSTYNQLHLDFMADMADGDPEHTNLHGAIKITDYLGNMLVSEYDISSHRNSAWDSTKDYYATLQDEYSLSSEKDLVRYLMRINRDDYAIFLSVKDEATSGLNDSVIDAIRALGFDFELPGHYRSSYLAIKSPDEKWEAYSDTNLFYHGTVRNGTVQYSLTSAGYDCGNTSSICINGKEYSQNSRGLNIVVFDAVRKQVVDSVCFDTNDPALSATR